MKKRWIIIAFVLTFMSCTKDKPEDVIPEEKIKTCNALLSNYRCVYSDSLHVEGIVDGQRIVFSHCGAIVRRKFGYIALNFVGNICLDSLNLLTLGTDSAGGDNEVFIKNIGDTVLIGTISPGLFSFFFVYTTNLKTLKSRDNISHPSKTNFITITKVNHDTSYVEGSFAIDIKRDSLPNFVLTEGKFRLKECLEK